MWHVHKGSSWIVTPVRQQVRHSIIFCLVLDLNSTENITLERNVVSFFFGDRVLIPDDNILIDDEQCFEIGLDCTVKNLLSLVEGESIAFEAFVETDNRVTTSTRNILLQVS